MKWEAEFENLKYFGSIIEALSGQIDDMILIVDENGIYTRAMDASRICYTALRINSSAFEIWSNPFEEEFKLCIKPVDIYKYLKAYKSGSLKFEYSSDNDNVLNLTIIQEDTSVRLGLPLLTAEYDLQKEINVSNLGAKVTIKSKNLHNIIKNCTVADKNLTLKATGEMFTILGMNKDTGESITVDTKDCDIETGSDEIMSLYSGEYLAMILKNQLSEWTDLEFGDRAPIMIYQELICDIKGSKRSIGSIKSMIAPRAIIE